MKQQHIFIIEDEKDIRNLIVYSLQKEHFKVTGIADGLKAIDRIHRSMPDLVLLDLMLPGINGLEICRHMKSDALLQGIPIIMLTAKSEESDIIAGLEAGADDYITKPFSPNVLNARIHAVLRRRKRSERIHTEILSIQTLTIHTGRHEVKVHDRIIPLTQTEFAIVYYLAQHPGWVFTRDQIINAVHGSAYPVTDRSIDVQIVSLRKKLGTAGKYINTVHGIGYRFTDEQ